MMHIIMSILYLVICTTSVSSMSSPETTSSSLASARQSPADVSAEKTFGLTLSAGSLPQLWANTSAVSTWAAVAGNLALVVAGAVLGHRIADRGDTGEEEEDTSASNRSIRRFIITEKAPTRAFSWLKAATTTFTFKTLLRHYAKWALTPRSLNVKLGPRRKGHKGRAVWLAYCLIAAHPL